MTWRLVLGVVYMQRRSLLGILVLLALFSRPRSLPGWIVGGLPLLMAVGAGTGAQAALATRGLVTLPLGPRELHRAAWLLATVLPIALLTVGRGLGGGWHALISDDGAWVFDASAVRVVFECLFLGLIGAWVVKVPEHHQSALLQDASFLRRSLLLKMLGMAAVAIIPFVVIPRLPSTLGGVSPTLWVIAVALLALGLAPLIRPPHSSRRMSPPSTSPASSPVQVRSLSPAGPLVLSRLQGVWALLPGLAVRAFLLALVMVVFLVFAQADKVVTTIWRPFDASLTPLRFFTTICLPLLMLIGMLPGLGNRLSLLKWLPLTSSQVATILALAPAATPVLFWMMLFVIQVAITAQWPPALHLGLFVAFIGAASLVDALGVKSGSSMMKFVIGAPLVLAFTYGMDDHRALMTALVDHWSVPVVGLACLGLGVLVNFHTLTRSHRSSRVYRFGRTDLPEGAQ